MNLSKRPFISVIICTYNSCEKLRNVLSDLVKQDGTSDFGYEVLIIDNNSKDKTKEVYEKFNIKYPGLFKYFFEGRQGKTYALNMGICESQGNILAFTDDDVLIDNKWLASIKAAFDAHPSCRAFGGRIIPIWPDKIPSWVVREGPCKNTGGPLGDHDKGDMRKSYHDYGMFAPCGANMSFRKEVFEEYGNFKEDLNARIKNIPMCEDTEVCFRLLRNKEEIIYIPNAVVYHSLNPGQLTREYFRKHVFKSGRAFALMNDDSGQYRRLFNVPGHIYRIIIDKILKYVASAVTMDRKRKFYYELGLIYYAGIFYEYYLGNHEI